MSLLALLARPRPQNDWRLTEDAQALPDKPDNPDELIWKEYRKFARTQPEAPSTESDPDPHDIDYDRCMAEVDNPVSSFSAGRPLSFFSVNFVGYWPAVSSTDSLPGLVAGDRLCCIPESHCVDGRVSFQPAVSVNSHAF